MQPSLFKPKAIALLVAGLPMVTQAALYTVERIDNVSAEHSAMATAISTDGNKVAVDVFSGPEGINFSEELPFLYDVEHFINSYDDLYNYCINNLGYSTCEVWANEQFYGVTNNSTVCTANSDINQCKGGYNKQLQAWTNGYTSNQSAFINQNAENPFIANQPATRPTGTLVPNSTDVIIHRFSDIGTPIGASSSPYYQEGNRFARAFIRRGFSDSTMLLPPASLNTKVASFGQTNAYGQISTGGINLVYGSASVETVADPANGNKTPEGIAGSLNECLTATDPLATRNCQYLPFANQASVWTATGAETAEAVPIATFPSGTHGNGDDTAQAAIRSAANVTGAGNYATLTGFSTQNIDGRFFAQAMIFRPANTGTLESCLAGANPTQCWQMQVIPGTQVKPDELLYKYSHATDINDKGIVIGELKNANPINGSFAEYIYAYDSTTTGNAQIIGSGNSALFFNGYNATAAAINNSNEIVGKVDVENSQDRERRQRAYIYLHGNAENLAKFNNIRGWLIDDLTNDGVISGNQVANAFRIAEAFDINDNGEIAASAFYCENGYETLAKNARCATTEQLVAVKLTPTLNGTIQARSEEEGAVTRAGAGIGFATFGLFALAGFFRRKKS